MSERPTTHEQTQDEQRLAELIRRAGAREQPPAAAAQAVREAVAAEWRAVVAERRRRRALATRWSAAAAAVLVAGLAVWLAAPRVGPDAPLVASLERVSGPVQVGGGLLAGWSAARAGTGLAQDAEIRSGAGGRAALRVGGASLRLDENSVLAMTGPDRIALRQGAIYVDAGEGTANPPLVVETAYGEVRHLGTQYETRLTAGGLRVRVREGRVRLTAGPRSAEGAAGEQVTLAADGGLARAAVARSGGEWAWVEDIAPQFDMNDRTLLEFLRWVGRETGQQVTFDSPAAEQAARELVLRGSVAGLAPRQALSAVLTTTQLHGREAGDVLHIDFRTGD